MSGGGKEFTKVAVLKGGPSAEREVSLRSGAAVAKGLRDAGYDVVEIDITGQSVALPRGIQAVFIALHGEFGEDGRIQQILQDRGIPYTGSGPAASAAAFDKRRAKDILCKNGILTPEYEILRRGHASGLPLPVVVKPPCQGSSLGVYRIFRRKQWKAALKGAFAFDDELLVERYVKGRELTVGVVGRKVLPVVEIIAPGGWYSYTAKYGSSRKTRRVGRKTRYLVPAPLPAAVADACADAARRTFVALGCRGMGRVDLRLTDDGQAHVLELNSIPGFTETSLLPKAAQAAGMSFAELCDKIMRLASLDRGSPRGRVR